MYAWHKATGLLKRKYTLLILASLLYVANWFPLQVLNLIPIGCIISSLLVWYAMAHYRLLDLGPIAQVRLVEKLPDGVIVIDNTGQIFSTNPAAERILGIELTSGQLAPAILQTWTDHTDVNTLDYNHPDGRVLHLRIDNETLQDAQGQTIGILIMLRDLTQLHQAEIKLRGQIRNETARQERQQMARDLHDSIVQSLHSASLLVDNLKRLPDQNNTSQSHKLVEGIAASVRQALREMRLMIYQWQPGAEKLNFISCLKDRLASVEERVGLQVNLSLDSTLRLPPVWEANLSAITSEALNNIIKHADASEVRVTLVRENDRVQLTVQDNGCGFHPHKSRPGHMGLKNMQTRADFLGAKLQIQLAPAEGTLARLDIPLPNAEGGSDDD